MSARGLKVLALAVAIALTLSACAWGHTGGNAARNGANPFEPSITVSNASQLQPSWQASGGDPVMSSKYVYAVGNGQLNAYAADGPASPEGASRCAGDPVVCSPVWFGRLADSELGPPGAIVLDGDVVFAAGYLGGSLRLVAFAADPAGCPPGGCAPLWTGAWGGNTLFGFSLTVADGRVYISSYPNEIQGFPYVVAFDARGITNCSAGPPRTCSPLFRAQTDLANGQTPQVAVTGGRLFVSYLGPWVQVFDAAGQSGCTSGICSELYRLGTPGTVSISGTTAYAVAGATLQAFDANGTTVCTGTPRVCRPTWTGTMSANVKGIDPPTVSNGKVVVFEEGTPTTPALEAFDAAGVAGCTGAPAVCRPLWAVSGAETAGFPNRLAATPSLLFVGGATLKVFDLAGVTNCAGAPKRCTALTTLPLSEAQWVTRPAVALGRIAISDSVLRVFSVPG